MKISYDKEADALVILMHKGKVKKDRKISENVFAGFSKDEKLIEIQILDISSHDIPWFTVEATAKLLNKSERTILRWIESGKLQSKKIGREYRIKPEDLDEAS